MKMKKVWALLVSLMLIVSMALPAAVAVSDDQGASAAAASSEEVTPTVEETPAEDAGQEPEAEPEETVPDVLLPPEAAGGLEAAPEPLPPPEQAARLRDMARVRIRAIAFFIVFPPRFMYQLWISAVFTAFAQRICRPQYWRPPFTSSTSPVVQAASSLPR